MKEKTQTNSEPSWLDPRNERKTPFTDAELQLLADDFIARMADTQAWQDLVAEVGEPRAWAIIARQTGCDPALTRGRAILKQRLAGQEPNSSINWQRR